MTSALPPIPEAPRRRVNIALVVIGLVAVLVAALVVVVLMRDDKSHTPTGKQDPLGSVKGAVGIKAADGVVLGAQVTQPTTPGKHPLVVMPSSFGATSEVYNAIAAKFVGIGFVTVAYTQRGFHNSGGQIDFAGPKTQRDASTVIDWALKHTSADPKRIGMLGESYGAGISLLTAAHDKRVRGVVAMSTWSSLADAFHPNDTTNVSGLGSLLASARNSGRASSELTSLTTKLTADPFGNADDLVKLSRNRSPADYVSQLNANKPAIMMANGWEDSLFPPAMLVPFFDKLTTPKRLQFAFGDHGGPENTGLTGAAQNPTIDKALAWLGHYVAGADNGADREKPVQLEDVTTRAVHTYDSWPTGGTRVFLDRSNPTGTGVGTAPATWSTQLQAGQDTAAKAPPSQFVAPAAFQVGTASLIGIPADRGLVWSGTPVSAPTPVIGSAQLDVSLAASQPAATFFTYLYDTAADGSSRLMTITPYTATGLQSGSGKAVSVGLEPIAWTLPAGHRLSVVVDTVEPRWFAQSRAGSTLTFSSSTASPATITVPVR